MAQVQKKFAYYFALDILSRRLNSEYEIRQKLARKSYESKEIDQVVIKLKDNLLLNDDEFAIAYVHDILLLKSVGPRLLSHKLNSKGIRGSTASRAIQSALEEKPEQELVLEAAAKWKKNHPKHAEDTERLKRFLISRGFSFEAIGPAFE